MAGWSDGWPLNAIGTRQAQALARGLVHAKIDALYSSPLERAQQTADVLARVHRLSIEIRREFGEIEIGDWQNQPLHDLDQRRDWREFNAFRSGAIPPNGTASVITQARYIDMLLTLREQHDSKTVAIVSHADPIRYALAWALGSPLDLISRIEISPGSVSALDLDRWNARIQYVNHTFATGATEQ